MAKRISQEHPVQANKKNNSKFWALIHRIPIKREQMYNKTRIVSGTMKLSQKFRDECREWGTPGQSENDPETREP